MYGTTIKVTTPHDAVTITGTGVFEGLTYDRLDHWERVAAADLEKTKRPGRRGDFAPTKSTLPGRVITIEGQYFGSDVVDAAAMRERILALYGDGEPVEVEVSDPLRTTRRTCFVENVEVPWTARPFLNYSIDLYAPDPLRYGDPVVLTTGLAKAGTGLALPGDEATSRGLLLPDGGVTGAGLDFGSIPNDGRILVANAGSAPTPLLFTVSGGGMPDGFEVVDVDTGQRITYVGPIANGSEVVVESDLEAAFSGGAPAGRYVTSSDWWSLAPRSTSTLAFLARGPVTGSPRLTVTTRPAFY